MNTRITSYTAVAVLFLLVGLGLGYFTFSDRTPVTFAADEAGESGLRGLFRGDDAPQGGSSDTTVQQDETVSENTAVVVSGNTLTDGQRALAASFGIDPDTVTISQEMIACAEARLGTDRLQEITNGATPSFGEGVQLAGCYAGN